MRFDRARYFDQFQDPVRSFGRGPVRVLAASVPAPQLTISDDVKLFASTFAAGFLFVTLFIA